MSRLHRLQIENGIYHVMNRGNDRKAIVFGTKDYFDFLDLLKIVSERFQVEIYAFCLMTNHFHLLLKTKENNLAVVLKFFGQVYTQRFNRRYKHDGHVFRGRYRSLLVQYDDYFFQVLRYIHLNPVKAGMIGDPKEYAWSSHRQYLSRACDFPWLRRSDVLEYFGGINERGIQNYLRFIGRGNRRELELMYSRPRLPQIIGSDEYIFEVEKSAGGLALLGSDPEGARPPFCAWSSG